MKKIVGYSFLGLLLFCAVLSKVFAADYTVDPMHSSIIFDIRHMFSTVNGRFSDFTGEINYDPRNPAQSKVAFTVKVNSINTSNERRDNDLKSSNFFDVTLYPEATFKSTKVIPTGNNHAKLIGDLTIHGVTRKVTFDTEFLGQAKDPWGNQRSGFTASTVIHRKDFGITWNKVLDNGSLLVGDDANLKIDVEAILKKS